MHGQVRIQKIIVLLKGQHSNRVYNLVMVHIIKHFTEHEVFSDVLQRSTILSNIFQSNLGLELFVILASVVFLYPTACIDMATTIER